MRQQAAALFMFSVCTIALPPLINAHGNRFYACFGTHVVRKDSCSPDHCWPSGTVSNLFLLCLSDVLFRTSGTTV